MTPTPYKSGSNASSRSSTPGRDFQAPSVGDRWLDTRGEGITITGVSFSRVTFVRDGYEHPCVYPAGRFTREFKPATPTAH